MTECRFGRSELFYTGERAVPMAQTRNNFIAPEKDMKESPLERRRNFDEFYGGEGGI
jgi:hypothetical protein